MDSATKKAADFRGKKIATPQLGNKQDIARRAWLVARGLKITQMGGDAHALPLLSLLQQRKIDDVERKVPQQPARFGTEVCRSTQ